MHMLDLIHEVKREALNRIPLVTGFSVSRPAYIESNEADYIVLTIETSLPINDALDALDSFDDGWWIANMRRSCGKLLIDVGAI
jgi:hypothetical protein